MNKFPLVLTILICITFSLPALDLPSAQIVDDSALRISLMDSWFNEIPARVLNKRPEIYTLAGGGRVQVRIETSRDEFGIVLARELDNVFPGYAQGSWVLTRSRTSGEALRIRVFLKSDPNTYIQFRPFTRDKCQMDVVIYESYIINSMPVAIPFERLLVLPVENVLAAVGSQFPRNYFDPDPNMYKDTRAFISAVRSRLPALQFADDGAIDENGNYVYIETLLTQNASTAGLNCSGFAKWIVDGILKPITGERLPITPLKQAFGSRGSNFTVPYDELRDPFFGLDWCRNLASNAMSVLRSPAYAVLEEFEVRNWPFSQVILRDNGSSSLRTYPGFLPDVGFGVEGLQPLLYSLAINEPGRIYLAAVNTEIGAPTTADNLRGLPRLRQYFHIAVLVPYFNEQGNFQVTVFESAAETSFTAFRNRYPGHFVNLTRIPVDGSFNPD